MEPSKTVTCKTEVEHLGSLVGDGFVGPIAAKAADTARTPLPTTREQLSSFLGMSGWHLRPCSTKHADIADKLVDVPNDTETPFSERFDVHAQDMFHEIRNLGAAKLRRTSFDPSLPVELWCDHAPTGMAAVTVQNNNIVDVKADGKCGYHAIDALLGMGEDSWSLVHNVHAHTQQQFDLKHTLKPCQEASCIR